MPGQATWTLAVVFVSACASGRAQGAIDVEFRPERLHVDVGDVVRVGLYVQSDSGVDQLLGAAQVIVAWEPAFLRLSGVSSEGGAALLVSSFPSPDPFGLNERNPPADGLGMYVAFAPLGGSVAATPEGTLLTTLLFEALAPTPGSEVSIVEQAGMPVGRTTVFDGVVPNRDVTGVLGAPVVVVIPSPSGAAMLGGWVLLFGRRRRA